MRFPRSGGILAHPTVFPSRYGIGDLGDAAYHFVDFLVKSGQRLWQLLPLGPTGFGDSPYQSFSAFAGNPLLISPDRLVRHGYLPMDAITHVPNFPVHRVDFGPVIGYKRELLRRAHSHYRAHGTADQRAAHDRFCREQAGWLGDFALFMALKTHHMQEQGGVWNTWPEELARRVPAALDQWSTKLADQVALHRFEQFLFFQQWLELKAYANDRGIRIIGDVPIFVAFDSTDVWANPDLFILNEDNSPAYVAGVPPDYFSETGQRWGNPLYRWERMGKNGYAWWAGRLRMTFAQVDIVRIDHFRGFEAFWEIPAEEPTAVIGRWAKGPGATFFHAMVDTLGDDLPIIAEDLGVITPEVKALRDGFDFPGMKILQFAFGGEQESDFLPHNYESSNCVVYTGTHDNETTIGWYQNASELERDYVRRYLARDGHDIGWDLIRLAYGSIADVAVATLQDLMGLGNEARMNYPSKPSGNWQWRYSADMLTGRIAGRLYEMTKVYGRLAEEKGE